MTGKDRKLADMVMKKEEVYCVKKKLSVMVASLKIREITLNVFYHAVGNK